MLRRTLCRCATEVHKLKLNNFCIHWFTSNDRNGWCNFTRRTILISVIIICNVFTCYFYSMNFCRKLLYWNSIHSHICIKIGSKLQLRKPNLVLDSSNFPKVTIMFFGFKKLKLSNFVVSQFLYVLACSVLIYEFAGQSIIDCNRTFKRLTQTLNLPSLAFFVKPEKNHFTIWIWKLFGI